MKRYIYKLVKKINTSIITRKEMEAQAESLNRKSNQIRFIYSLEKFQALQQETFTEKLPKSLERIKNISKHLLDLNLLTKNKMHLRLFIDFTNILKIYESQLNFLLEMNVLKEGESNESILSAYSILQEYMIPIKSKEEICLPTLCSLIEFLDASILEKIEQTINKIETQEKQHDKILEIFEELYIQKSKLEASLNSVILSASFDKNDIFAKPISDEVWQNLLKNAEIKILGSSHDIKEQYMNFTKTLHVANLALCTKEKYNENNAFVKKLAFGMSAAYFWLHSEKASKETQLFFAKPNQKIVFEFWNLNDNLATARNFLKLLIPSVKTHKKLYIERYFEPITLDKINEELNETQSKTQNLSKQTDKKEKITSDLFVKGENKLKLRLICDKKFDLTHMNEPKLFDPKQIIDSFSFRNMIACCTDRNANTKTTQDGYNDFEEIILHIHGGGFVAQSSSSHQIYTREWAKALKIPVFSLDYRLAPEHPYPAAFDDCWQAYNWLLNYAEHFLHLRFKKIILAGDSAGGNLALAITFWAIKQKMRIPDGIFLAYPALNLDVKQFTPSVLLTLEDQIIPYSILTLCINSYIQNEKWNVSKDIFLTPISASNEILKEMPICRMMVGDFDPLHDNCWRFLKKLQDLKKDAKLIVYKDMPHGFLNYGIPNGISNSEKCVADSSVLLLEMMKKLKTAGH